MDNHRHGSGDATHQARFAIDLRTKDVVGRTVGVTLSPFGLNEHALRSGVASESLVDKFVPFVLYLSSLGGIERLVLANELGIACIDILG